MTLPPYLVAPNCTKSGAFVAIIMPCHYLHDFMLQKPIHGKNNSPAMPAMHRKDLLGVMHCFSATACHYCHRSAASLAFAPESSKKWNIVHFQNAGQPTTDEWQRVSKLSKIPQLRP